MTIATPPARTRFAPSPTGSLHIGSARTALYAWLLARQTGGQFLLRIEDTDRNRFVEGATQEIIEGLRWLGLDWDEGPDVGGPHAPYVQSERLPIYAAHARQLLDAGRAYESYWSPLEMEAWRSENEDAAAVDINQRLRSMTADEMARRRDAGVAPAVLFKVDNAGETVTHDLIRGEMRTPNKTLRDPVLLKSDGYPTYHLAALVDDRLMDISHVIRAQEWLPSFPVHAQIIDAFGWQRPLYIHPSVLLNPSGKGKMSKRFVSDKPIFVRGFKDMGYLPEAVLNWVALMGWAESGGDKEVYTVPQLVEAFDLDRVKASPAAVSFEKADWLNKVHIRALAPEDLAERLLPFLQRSGLKVGVRDVMPLVPLVQERITTLDEAAELLDFFFVEPPMPPAADLVPGKLTPGEATEALAAARDVLATVEAFDAATLDPALRGLAEARGMKAGDLLSILRVALSSKRVAPPLFETLALLGRETSLARLDRALGALQTA